VGLLNQLGTEVTVSGPFSCPAQEGVWEMQISVAQESTLAAARGIGNGVCQGEIRTFVVSAVTRDGTPVFVDGTALVCALFVRGHGADIGRVAHWCNFIRLQH
jgi:hypothetical protein